MLIKIIEYKNNYSLFSEGHKNRLTRQLCFRLVSPSESCLFKQQLFRSNLILLKLGERGLGKPSKMSCHLFSRAIKVYKKKEMINYI